MLNWLIRLFPQVRKLQKENQQLKDDLWKSRQRESHLEDVQNDLLDRYDDLRRQLDAKTAEIANYIAAISNLPPINNPHEWLTKRQELQLEQQKIRESHYQKVIQEAEARLADARNITAETLQQVPSVVETQFDEFQEQRKKYLADIGNYFDNELRQNSTVTRNPVLTSLVKEGTSTDDIQ